jgi:pimeloyl-ACP methyl ester carboxylesterase
MSTQVAVNETASLCGHQAQFIDVDGIRTRYYDVGEGTPMLLCHGGAISATSSANTWTLNIAGLSKHFRVLAPDRLGCGMTDNPPTPDDYTMHATMAHMNAFLRTMDLDEVHIVGQSTGGYVATQLVLDNPDISKTLVMVDSASTAPDSGDFAQRRRILFSALPRDTTSPTFYFDNYQYHMSVLSYTTDHVTDDWIGAAAYMRGLPKGQKTDEVMASGGRETYYQSKVQLKEQTLARIRQGELTLPTLLHWGRNDPSAIFE